MAGKRARIVLVEFAVECPHCHQRCERADAYEGEDTYAFSEVDWPDRVKCEDCGRTYKVPGDRITMMMDRGIAPAARRD